MAANKHIRIKHGHASKGVRGRTKTYKTWRSMMQRCYREKEKSYIRYGAKGIIVCERWHDFVNFLADMGEVPEGLTIERKDSTGNYEPDNCCWATMTEQVRNRSNTVKWTFNGETRPLAEWSELTGIKYTCLQARVNSSGWSIEKALTTPTLTIHEVSALGAKAQWDFCR